MNIFTQFFAKKQDSDEIKQDIRRSLLTKEAEIGKHVFGPIPAGHDREFFRIDTHTWIWQETWREDGHRQKRQTKYLVREREMVKSVNGGSYERISSQEAKNLYAAIKVYTKRVKAELYNQKPKVI